MKFARSAAALAIAAALGLSACAPPTTAADQSAGKDENTGTVRVWLFSEVNQAPKQKVVDEAVAEFEAAHSGADIEVQYIPVDTRAERFKAAFNDPSSAPDVAEYGNTDLAGYVAAGGLADITDVVSGWDEGKDLDQKIAATTQLEGKTYGVPWFVGVRSLYYRTDLFEKAGLKAPTTLKEVEESARALRAADKNMLGISVGGKAQFIQMPYVWAHGGEIAEEKDGAFTSALTSEGSRAGVTAYTNLLKDDICPAKTCAGFGGNDSVQQFIAGKSAMTVGGDFNYNAVKESAVGDKFAVVPLPGTTAGSIAPAFAGGNNLGVFKSSSKATLAGDFVKLLGGKKYQEKMFAAMGNLPTFSDVQSKVATENAYLKPFVDTLAAGTKFVPNTAAWNGIDAKGTFTTLFQSVATGAKDVNAATEEAAKVMDAEFKAGQ